MAFEIEHKYLVKNDSYRSFTTESIQIYQGYLCRQPERTIRIRIKEDKGYITIKGKNTGAVRLEFEYEIPIEDAKKMMTMCIPPILEKIRHIVPFEGHIWEVDEFLGNKLGLVTAEIELTSEDEEYAVPEFVGEDVTGNPAYYNSNL
ncbi:MAG: CYTH domain-containing protein [Muribaculaceae bacterium]|nr:CYTH domain-containing protein [Muribaculaceae bacterium]